MPETKWIRTVVALALSGAVHAGVPVKVTVTGVVECNQIASPPLGDVQADDPVTLTLIVDSDVFVPGAFPVRGYEIAKPSFSMTLGAVEIGLEDPFPGGTTPYFVLRDNDPAVDGFYLSTDVNGPIGVPLDQTGAFTQFLDNFSVTYGPGTLSSLDILDALGTYDFSGLTVFNWTIDDGPFNPMIIVFEELTIEALQQVPTLPQWGLGVMALLMAVAGATALQRRSIAA